MSVESYVILVALVGTGSVIGVALKLAWDGNRNAGTTHDKAFDKGFMSRNAEVDGLRRQFEERFSEMERELVLLRSTLVRMIRWVKDEHRDEAFELLLKLGMPASDLVDGDT